MRISTIGLCLAIAITTSSAAAQEVAGPSFNCSAARDTLARLICSDSRLSRLDLAFVQSFQALQQQLDDIGRRDLRFEANDFQNTVYDRCQLVRDLTGSTPLPSNSVGCVADLYTAAQEAARPLPLHVALQRDLQLLGYLPAGAVIDGNYGTATRGAIIAWQSRRGLQQDGLLGDAAASLLQQDVAQALAAQARQDQALIDLQAHRQQADQARDQTEQARLAALTDLESQLNAPAGTADVLVALRSGTRISKTTDGGLALADPAHPSRNCRIAAAGVQPAFMTFALHRVLGEVVSGIDEMPPACAPDLAATTDVLVVFDAAQSPADRETAVAAIDAVGAGTFRVAGHVTIGDWRDFLKQHSSAHANVPDRP
jgi:hypothetical protein